LFLPYHDGLQRARRPDLQFKCGSAAADTFKQVFSQSASAADPQKRSYFSPVRCRQEVPFALWGVS